MKTKLFILSIILAACFSLMVAHAVSAQNAILQDNLTTAPSIGNLKKEKPNATLQECFKNGDCSIEHILLLANSVIRWAVAVSGSLALLMYVIGGVWMIFSQGNPGRIQRGKDIVIGTSVSLIFILGSWIIIQFALQSLGVKPQYELQQTTCGGKPSCPTGQICDNNTCRDRCAVEKASQDTTHPWSCQPFENCGFTSVEECGNDPKHCVRNLCAGSNNRVCCWKPE